MALIQALLRTELVQRRYEKSGAYRPDPLLEERGRPGLSVVVAAHNEQDVIRGCLESVKPIATEIVVVDAESTDATVARAREYTDRLVETTNKLMVEANKNIGIDAASCEWILLLDPDERVSPALRDAIAQVLRSPGPYAAYGFPRRNYELGKWIRTLGHYPNIQIRLVRRGRGRYTSDELHRLLDVAGRVGLIGADLIHVPHQAVWDYAQKRNFYSEHDARLLFDRREPFRARRMLLAPAREFTRQYLFMGGWLDGVAGFLIATHGGWSELLVQAKLWQLWQQEGKAGGAGRGR